MLIEIYHIHEVRWNDSSEDTGNTLQV